MASILIVDDDESICKAIASIILPMGHEVSYCLRLEEGLSKVFDSSFDLVFLDVSLPDGNGLRAVPKVKAASCSPEVVIITGEGSVGGAELAIKSGAWDYIEKPLLTESIKLPLLRVLQYRKEKLSNKSPLLLEREGIIGDTPQINHCLRMVANAAQTDSNTLITGETGTGKELFARAIHANSHRLQNALVIVDCAALPDTLIESVLFGHEKGAYTGADRKREGLIKEADGGTLFLDEVGELPMQVQSSFLRVLQERCFRPVGSKTEIQSDFRLIAATNRDLDEMVKAGIFRQDLFFRLNSIVIDIPPLRKRTKDIKNIAFHFMKKFCERYSTGLKGFSPEYLEAINNYDWPGNVRELINAIERSISIAEDHPTLYPIHLPVDIRSSLVKASVTKNRPEVIRDFQEERVEERDIPLKELLENTEKEYFQHLISRTNGDIARMGEISGLSRAKIYSRLKKYQISKS